MNIYITQWICEKRHCLFAVPWEGKDYSKHKDVELLGDLIIVAKNLPMRCTICGGGWLIEHGKTEFKHMAEAVHAVMETAINTHMKRAAYEDLQATLRN